MEKEIEIKNVKAWCDDDGSFVVSVGWECEDLPPAEARQLRDFLEYHLRDKRPTKATAPKDYDPGKNGYITPGKTYQIERLVGSGFYIFDDKGMSLFCLPTECAHIDCMDWILS